MTEPTEAEVEAAMAAIRKALFEGTSVAPPVSTHVEEKLARAALTAAAQVREPAVSLAHILTQARRVRNFSDPSQVFEAVPVRALGAETPQQPDLGPLPIYGATEAPSDDITVQCSCGWVGKKSATATHHCSRCDKIFTQWPSEPDYGPDFLGERPKK